MRFADIPAHETAIRRLTDMIDADRLPHALLISGPPGIGKFMLARAAAQYIHCENPVDGDSCGMCPSCRQHASFNHIDTHFEFPVLKGKRNTVVSDDYMADFREFMSSHPWMDFQEWIQCIEAGNSQPIIYVSQSDDLLHKLSYTTHSARYKVVLMWLPEKLQESAANKLLKLIEEPHPDTRLIMVSDAPAEILPTIYSRCQRLELKRLPDVTVASYLSANYNMAHDDAMAVAHIADGSMTRAIGALNLSKEKREFLDLFMALMRMAYQRDVRGLKDWAVRVAALGREPELRFIEYCARLIRENFIYNIGIPEINYLNRDEAAFSRNFARFVNAGNVERIATELDSTWRDIAGNANSKIVLFDMAVRMIMYIKQ